jgi:hypothetical protein
MKDRTCIDCAHWQKVNGTEGKCTTLNIYKRYDSGVCSKDVYSPANPNEPKDKLKEGIKREVGEKRSFETGARKQPASDKGTPVLFPGDAYLEISKHFEDGARIYDARNWEKGIPLSELINSLERHIAQEKMGLTDERHDRAIAWNAVVYLATKLRVESGVLPSSLADIPAIDNRVGDKKDG